MPQTWIPKRLPQKKGGEIRLLGCKAYPTTGIIAGAPVEWCRANQGAWCGECKHRGQ